MYKGGRHPLSNFVVYDSKPQCSRTASITFQSFRVSINDIDYSMVIYESSAASRLS